MNTDVCHKTGKHGYRSRAQASRAKASINERLTRNRPALSVYRCRACGNWHIGRER